MSRHTRGSWQDIHSTRVPHTEGRLWMAQLHSQTQRVQTTSMDGSGARHDDHGTTTLYTHGRPTQDLAGGPSR